MADPKPLSVVAAFGRRGSKPILLAAHPDEEHLPTGDPVPNRRTLVLELDRGAAKFVDEYPAPLTRAWMSTNGTAYCSSLNGTEMHVYRGGKWSTEEFSATPVTMVADIFGFSGETSDDDIVFATAPGKLFVRRGGTWSSHDAPGDITLGSVHGLGPDDMFVGGEQLLRFDGTQLEEIENPDHSVRVVSVTEDDRLIGGWDLLSITTADGGWEAIEAGMEDFMDLAQFGGSVYAGTFDDGVQQVYPGPVTAVSPGFAVTNLVNVGDSMLAIDEGIARSFDGTTWTDVSVPMCEVGKRPS